MPRAPVCEHVVRKYIQCAGRPCAATDLDSPILTAKWIESSGWPCVYVIQELPDLR